MTKLMGAFLPLFVINAQRYSTFFGSSSFNIYLLKSPIKSIKRVSLQAICVIKMKEKYLKKTYMPVGLLLNVYAKLYLIYN
jgi:hypothetical protein